MFYNYQEAEIVKIASTYTMGYIMEQYPYKFKYF